MKCLLIGSDYDDIRNSVVDELNVANGEYAIKFA